MEQVKPTYYRYWGKSAEGGGYCQLPYPCRDVAVVGDAWLNASTSIANAFIKVAGLSLKQTRALLFDKGRGT